MNIEKRIRQLKRWQAIKELLVVFFALAIMISIESVLYHPFVYMLFWILSTENIIILWNSADNDEKRIRKLCKNKSHEYTWDNLSHANESVG